MLDQGSSDLHVETGALEGMWKSTLRECTSGVNPATRNALAAAGEDISTGTPATFLRAGLS